MRCEPINELAFPVAKHGVIVVRKLPKFDYYEVHTKFSILVNYHDDQRSIIGRMVGDPMPEHARLREERRKE